MARVRHGLRLFGATLLGAFVGGAVAGFGARVAMYVIRLMNDSHNGEVTHSGGYPVGRVTFEGTLELVLTGALFYGLTAVPLYLLARRFLPGGVLTKGLLFGGFLLVLSLGALIDLDGYEYVRFVTPAVAVPLFASLFFLFGLVMAWVAERVGRGVLTPPANRLVHFGGRLALAAVTVAGLIDVVRQLQDEFGFFA